MSKQAYQIRYCTGGCRHAGHAPHIYSVDPVDGDLKSEHLCPGNSGPKVMEYLDEDTGEPEGWGYIAAE